MARRPTIDSDTLSAATERCEQWGMDALNDARLFRDGHWVADAIPDLEKAARTYSALAAHAADAAHALAVRLGMALDRQRLEAEMRAGKENT